MYLGTEKLNHTYMAGTPFAFEALSGVSFALSRGDFALLLGASGSGKSTLVAHLNGLVRPTAGKVFFEGRELDYSREMMPQFRRRIGLVFQFPEEQFFCETVFDEVAFAPRNLGLNSDQVAGRVEKALFAVGLSDRALPAQHPFDLSAGQKRLVAVAAVLSLEPEVLILDEPTAGLDYGARRRLFDLLGGLNRDEGMTIIVSTHHLEEFAALADRVLALGAGRLILDGSPSDLVAEQEMLACRGLALPGITGLLGRMADLGYPVRRDIFSHEGALREVVSLRERSLL